MSVLDLFRLDGKVAIVTGGGRGLGAQMAQGYVEAGAKVVLCSRRVENCEAVRDQIRAAGGEAMALPLNVTDPESVNDVVRQVIAAYGQVDILVNNSGASWGAPALDMPYDAWQKVIQTNLTGAFLMSQSVAHSMRDQGYGKIINITSLAGFRGTDPEVLDAIGYSASKGGIIALTRDLAVKWARYGIRVNAIAPGFFLTKMTKDVLVDGGQQVIQATPLHRLGGDRDLQGIALYFASAASDHVTGQMVAVDGGMSSR